MRHDARRRLRRAAALGTLIAGVGAVSAAVDDQESAGKRNPSWLPSRERALIVCVVQDEVTLTWHSERGRLYTILYTDKPSGDAIWSPLPGFVRMPGTGRTETLKFRMDPLRPRRFNLRVEDASVVRRSPSSPPPSGARPEVPKRQ